MQPSALRGLTRAGGHTALLRGGVTSPSPVLSAGVIFGETRAFLEYLGGSAEDLRQGLGALPETTFGRFAIAPDSGSWALGLRAPSGVFRFVTFVPIRLQRVPSRGSVPIAAVVLAAQRGPPPVQVHGAVAELGGPLSDMRAEALDLDQRSSVFLTE